LFPCGRGFCQCQLDEPPGALLEIMAADLLPACPVWMANVSPQTLARLRIVKGILVFVVIFIMCVGIVYGFIS
jgi:hypothetical protein